MIDKQNRTFCAYHFIGTIGALLMLMIPLLLSKSLIFFINTPIIIWTYGLTSFLLLSAFRKDFLRFIPEAILSLFFVPNKPNPRFAEIAKLGSRYVIGVGVIFYIIELILMLTGLEDPSQIGVGIALGLLTIFYALIASELFFISTYNLFSDGKADNKPLMYENLLVIILCLVIDFIVAFVLWC